MKVYIQPDTYSRGILRVCDALVQYAPEHVTFTQRPQDAEFEVLQVIGRHDATLERVELLRHKRKPYAMIQYCLRSTIRPDTGDWLDMWRSAQAVWSYYDLYALCKEDGQKPAFSFYHSPLGVDATVFRQHDRSRIYTILASSQHALSESVRECAFATIETGKKMFFLGHELRRGPSIVCRTGITDEELAQIYSQCMFVSGLRRTEGFEFPVIEGALCGAVPIVFDAPHYRAWYDEFAYFIPEGDRESVIRHLTELFSADAVMPINDAQKALIRERFNWQPIIEGFWNQAL